MTMQPNLRHERRRIADLKPHPLQLDYFLEPTESEVAALAADLRANGLRQPVEILPDGVILCGHSRIAAALRLGWDEIDVLVRPDLAARGPDAAERRLLEDNLVRRQMSKFQKLRALLRLWELDGRRPPWSPAARQRMREALGEPGMSDKNLARYLTILEGSPDVQFLFDTGAISLVDAERIARMPAPRQAELIGRLADGEALEVVVSRCVRAARARPADATAALEYRRLIRSLEAVLPQLEDGLAVLPAGELGSGRHIRLLERAAALVDVLLRRNREVASRPRIGLDEILARLQDHRLHPGRAAGGRWAWRTGPGGFGDGRPRGPVLTDRDAPPPGRDTMSRAGARGGCHGPSIRK